MSFLAVIDPPWTADQGGGGRGAQEHYALDDVSSVAASYYAARDVDGSRLWPSFNAQGPSLVFMWATAGAMAQHDNGNPPDAYVLARLLGVRVAAIFMWCKVDLHGADLFSAPARMGLGQWSRVEHEYLLLCRRGALPLPPAELRPRSVIYAPRGAHSAKPEQAWEQVIEPIAGACLPGVVGVEFNARRRRDGWSAVGRLDGESNPVRYEAAL